MMTIQPIDLNRPEARSVKAIIRTSELLLSHLATLLTPLNLTVSAANTLGILAQEPHGMSPNQISKHLLVTRGAVTQILDLLEQAALVERVRHPTDRRMLLIKLTSKGREQLRTIQPLLAAADTDWFSGLNKAEMDTLIDLLGRVEARLDGERTE